MTDTVFMLDDRIEIQDQINSELDNKVGTYEDNLWYMNTTLGTALGIVHLLLPHILRSTFTELEKKKLRTCHQT